MRHTATVALLVLLSASGVGADAWKRPRWADADHDCRDTRAEVLAAQCSAVTWDARGCRVQHAVCVERYSGAEIATDTASQSLQIDHVFPAHEAWVRRAWKAGEFEKFFNDAGNLLVTRSRTNGRKSDRMPQSWCPSDPAARPDVARQFHAVVSKYSLPLSPAERAGLDLWARGKCAAGATLIP